MSKPRPIGRLEAVCVALLSFGAGAYAANAPETFKCSARGGPEWQQYRSKHFVVATDLSRDSGAVLVKDLEWIYAMVLQAMIGKQVDLPGRTRVIAFGNSAQFDELAHGYGGYHSITSSKQSMVVIPVARLTADPETVAHELVHHLSLFIFPHPPRWFSEGLAEFIQTVASDTTDNEPSTTTGSHIVRGAKGGVGMLSREMSELLQIPPVKVKELLDWTDRRVAAGERAYYAQSWLLYHWLWNNRSKEFTEFQRRLTAAEDPKAAWRAALPEFDPQKPGALESLDKTLERYRGSPRYAFYRVKAEGDPAFSESKLPSADVHLLLLDGRLRSSQPELREPLQRAELEEALREDSSHPLAIARRAALDNSWALPELRNSVIARPKDAQAWLCLGRALSEVGNQSEAESAYRKAVALDADSAEAQNNLAALLVSKRQHHEALPFAKRALELAPWDPVCIDTLAAVAHGLGKCTQALVLQRRAVSITQLSDSLLAMGGDDAYSKRLREYETRCGPSASK